MQRGAGELGCMKGARRVSGEVGEVGVHGVVEYHNKDDAVAPKINKSELEKTQKKKH